MRGLRHVLWWAVVLVGTSCAAAPSAVPTGRPVEVSASLEAPAGAVRPGTYAAVRIRATNRTGETLTAVRVETGGPVAVTAPWRLAPNETAEKVLPVFYAGGDLVVAVTFTTMRGKDVTPEKSSPVSIRPLPSTLAADTDALVQPEAYRLFTSEGWSAKRLEHLWLWLVVFALAAGVAGTVRRPMVAAAVLVGLGAAASAPVWFFGDVRGTAVREARIFYVSLPDGQTRAERFVFLESRGGATARFRRPPGETARPIPVLADSDDLFRPQFTLVCDGGEEVAVRKPQVLVRWLETTALPFIGPATVGRSAKTATDEMLKALAGRADLVAALRIEGDRATDPSGRAQPIEAWAVEWKNSADPDVAYAGRSLGWWSRARREGDGAVILAWRHDAPAESAETAAPARWPALVVYGGAPAPD